MLKLRPGITENLRDFLSLLETLSDFTLKFYENNVNQRPRPKLEVTIRGAFCGLALVQ